MKLIDLEQQIFVPITDEALGTSYEVQMTVGEFFAKFFEGFQPETVEAVPVEWLKEKTQHSDSYKRGSAKWMLGCWKREQEAR